MTRCWTSPWRVRRLNPVAASFVEICCQNGTSLLLPTHALLAHYEVVEQVQDLLPSLAPGPLLSVSDSAQVWTQRLRILTTALLSFVFFPVIK